MSVTAFKGTLACGSALRFPIPIHPQSHLICTMNRVSHPIIFNYKTKQEVCSLAFGKIETFESLGAPMQFSPKGTMLTMIVKKGDRRFVKVWDVTTGKSKMTFELATKPSSDLSLCPTAISPDESLIAAVDGNSVKVWVISKLK